MHVYTFYFSLFFSKFFQDTIISSVTNATAIIDMHGCIYIVFIFMFVQGYLILTQKHGFKR